MTGAGGDRGSRRQNLSAVLTLLHRDGPARRSRLTELTGRNRSTMAALVGELGDLGLAFETDADPTRQVGRPSPLVSADGRNVAIAINPEVDAVTIGVVALGGEVVRRRRHENDRAPSPDDVVRVCAAAIEEVRVELGAGVVVHGVGVAVPGLVRAEDGLISWAPHLGWTDVPFAELLERAAGLPVRVGNDASLGAVAERAFGSGRGVEDLVYLNGGASGIGGGVVAGGALIGGADGFAGEFGHVRVDGAADPARGSLEAQVRRSALVDVLGLGSVDADELERELLQSEDAAVRALVHRQLEHLSVSISNVVNVLNPAVVVLGGFLASLFELDPGFLSSRVRALSIPASFARTSIVRAALGSDLLLIGAAELALAPLLADPGGVAPLSPGRALPAR